ncbi:unnamed protein product [Boreogadus saida]
MAHRRPAGLDIEAAGATAARGTVATTQENPRVNVGGWSRAGRAPWMLVRFAGLETSCMTINTSAPLVKEIRLLIELGASYEELRASYVKLGASYVELGASYVKLVASYVKLA